MSAKRKDKDIWVVLDLLDADQVIAAPVSALKFWRKFTKGSKGRFPMLNGAYEAAEIIEVCDQRMARQMVEFMSTYIRRRNNRIAGIDESKIESSQGPSLVPNFAPAPPPAPTPPTVSTPAPRPAPVPTSFGPDLIDKYNEQFDRMEDMLKKEAKRNESFRDYLLEQVSLYRFELDRIKELPGNEKLIGKKVPLFRFIDRQVIESLCKQSGDDHSKFFPLVFYGIFTPDERSRGIKKLPQEKLMELEQILRFFYPQESEEKDDDLWRFYRIKMSKYASSQRRQMKETLRVPSRNRLMIEPNASDTSRESSVSTSQQSMDISDLIPNDLLQRLIKTENFAAEEPAV